MTKSKKITIVGLGYVGSSLAVLLAQENKVIAFDIDYSKVDAINRMVSPIDDSDVTRFLSEKKLNISATLNNTDAYSEAEIIIICTPTDFNEETLSFNTSSIDKVIKDILKVNKDAFIVIKSTIPIGYTEKLQKTYNNKNIVFSPEFLREGNALKDNLFPSRIVIGGDSEECHEFVELLKSAAETRDKIQSFFVSSSEAESIKLFANTYLANRVAFFNEVDTFAKAKELNSKNIIEGICSDSRIGDYYNNPSFGYGGYCLPKDSKQLLSNFGEIPQSLIKATIDSNLKRKEFIAHEISSMDPKIIGVYKLSMKKNSDNFRSSAIFDIINNLRLKGFDIVIYEDLILEDTYGSCTIEKDLNKFKTMSDVIITNRADKHLEDVIKKVYTSDIFGNN